MTTEGVIAKDKLTVEKLAATSLGLRSQDYQATTTGEVAESRVATTYVCCN